MTSCRILKWAAIASRIYFLFKSKKVEIYFQIKFPCRSNICNLNPQLEYKFRETNDRHIGILLPVCNMVMLLG